MLQLLQDLLQPLRRMSLAFLHLALVSFASVLINSPFYYSNRVRILPSSDLAAEDCDFEERSILLMSGVAASFCASSSSDTMKKAASEPRNSGQRQSTNGVSLMSAKVEIKCKKC